MTSTSKGLFLIFAGLLVIVLAGLVILPGLTPEGAMPAGVAWMWLGWLFALWGSLVSVIVFLIAWVAEQTPEADVAGEQLKAA